MNSGIAKNNFCTEGKIRKIISEWNIKNFSVVLYDGEELKSPLLAGNGDNWYLTIRYSRKSPAESTYSKHLEIFIKREYSHFETVAKCKISILDADKQIIYFKESEAQKVSYYAPIECLQYVRREFLFDNNNRLLVNDTLTILCDISILEDTICDKGCNYQFPEYCPLDNLGLALETHRFCDVTFDVNGQNIRAHKLILVVGSSTFATMFLNRMAEQNIVICVDNVTLEVFKAMLKFMYTGKTTNLDKMAVGLLAAADTYALETLKVKCEGALTSKLGFENAASFLTLAHLHNAQHLKNAAVNYIRENAARVKETDNYKSMMADHPLLAAEV